MNYNKINNIFGWVAFLIATITYVLTLEPSTSFWDCGEFIACIYRLQVAHQPGAPLFTMLGKAFSLLSFGDNTKVAYWTNMASALASSATILFLFWTITALARKIVLKKAEELTTANLIMIIGAGLVGSLAYAFSDTFWFSAVESEVYAQSSLCTAVVFWAILKWDAHADEPYADRWIVFIAYVMGLSIGIHLLNLLVIPAIAVLIYFRRSKAPTGKGTLGALGLGVVVFGLILWGIIQYTVKFAAYFDLLFVNSFGLSFNSGALFFYALLIAALIFGIYYSIKNAKPILNIALICVVFILLGYSSFVMIVIRAKAGTNLNNSDPQDAFALNSYLNRDQYGETPLVYGQYFDAKPTEQNEGATLYRRGATKYEVAGKKINTVYDHNTLFPRMFSPKNGHPQFYRDWMQMSEDQSPTMVQNLGFFISWQINQMYTRYFLWNFAGRYNDLDGQNSSTGLDGNWTLGFKSKDSLPKSVTGSNAYNRLFALPLILGLLGAFFHFRRNQKDAGIVGLLFFSTGIAIVLYLNQDPLQPRERDYAYVGSFYAFAIWIGIGVVALADLLNKKLNAKTGAMLATAVCLLAGPVLMASQEWDDHDRSTKLTPRDMAANYLNTCAPNAILFTYGDNDTYPLWYAQEVEGIRPDVRIVNLSLLGTDWYIRQMKGKMNESAPLPITMPNEKFAAGVRDVIYYNDAKIAGPVEVKDIFDFVTSDDAQAKAQYENGESANYLPTKDFKITVNPDDVIKNGVVSADNKDKIAPFIQWTYNSNYVTKDNLAMLDILAHNNWKRPIYFSFTVGSENMIGLDKYLYNEGFALRLVPLTPDTTKAPMEASNTMAMYNNVMTKFKWGNMKHATYLDHESVTMFYPKILWMFANLSEGLMRQGRFDLARKTLRKYDEVMPDLTPYIDVEVRKYFITETAYRLGETKLANKWVNDIDTYIVDLLNYSEKAGDTSSREVQMSMSILDGLVKLTRDFHQTELNKKLDGQLKGYMGKLGAPSQGPQ